MYHRIDRPDAFQQILSEALKEEGFDDRIQKRYLFENEPKRIEALNALAGHQLNLADVAEDPDRYKQHMQAGIKLIEEASTISQDAASNWISKAFYEIAKGQLNSALINCTDFENLNLKNSTDIEQQGLRALCSLAKAIIEFNKGNYKESLSLIRNMIKVNPYAPSDMWFALGLCYYRTGNIPKAKLSFDKTVELDQNNSMALASLGIIEMVMG